MMKWKTLDTMYVLLVLFGAMFSSGCATTSQTASTSKEYYSLNSPPKSVHRDTIPDANHEIEGTLPLGIGARFDWLVTDAAENVSDVYNNVIQPIRRGKIFGRTPYELDYSILPKTGEAFYDPGSIDTPSMKSKYKIQVGMKRNFSRMSDFFDADFWLAKGHFNPSYVPPAYKIPKQVPRIVSQDEHDNFDWDAEYDIDWDSILDHPLEQESLLNREVSDLP